MITIYLPVFRWSWLERTLKQGYLYQSKYYGWLMDYEVVGKGKTKFLAILDYLKRGFK